MKEFKREELIKLIQDAELISFDIFDNAIVRPYEKPTDLFSHLEEIYDAPLFKERRINAELSQRSKIIESNIREEITYDEIYDAIEESFKFLKEKEIDLEKRTCLQNEEMYFFYSLAKKLDKKIIFTSDMYLPKNVIEQILSNTGYDKYEKLYLSCHDLTSKVTCKSYEAIKRDYNNINPSKILHIGDNKFTDYENALRSGIKAFWYPKIIDRFKENGIISEKLWQCLSSDTSSISGILLGTWALYWNKNKQQNYWTKFAYQYSWLPLFGFTQFVKEESQKDGIQKLFFLARDGLIIKNIFEIIDDSNKDTQYMYASRRLLRFSFLKKIEDEEIDWFLQGMHGATKEDFWLSFYIENPDLKKSFYKKFQKYKKGKLNKARILLKEFFNENSYEFLKEAKKEQDLLIKYLSDIGFLESNCAVIDIGWCASLQKKLSEIKKSLNKNDNFMGYYFGTHPEFVVSDPKYIKGYYMDKGFPEKNFTSIKNGIDIFEMLFTAPHESMAKIKKTDNGFEPIYQLSTNYEKKRISITSQAHLAIIDFTKFITSIFNNDLLKINNNNLNLTLEPLIFFPTKQDYFELQKIKTSANMGGVKYTSIAKQKISAIEALLLSSRYIKAKIKDPCWNPHIYPVKIYSKLTKIILKVRGIF